jgi:hypothetical protein
MNSMVLEIKKIDALHKIFVLLRSEFLFWTLFDVIVIVKYKKRSFLAM